MSPMQKRNLIAAVGYVTWIGYFIVFVMGDKTDRFVVHHLNQALVINLVEIVGGVLTVIPILGSIASSLVSMAVIVFDIMGALSAYQGSTASLPLIGDIHLFR